MNRFTRTESILQRFGISRDQLASHACAGHLRSTAGDLLARCLPGQIFLVSGASGSGKSQLLRELASLAGHRAALAHEISLPDEMVCDCLHCLPLERALETLSLFGLGEVYTYLSPAHRLSTGQQFRLRLAMAYARLIAAPRPRGLLIVDEFATQLDRTSACIIARNLRRVISAQSSLCAVVATCHDDLELALRPDARLHCDFGHYLAA